MLPCRSVCVSVTLLTAVSGYGHPVSTFGGEIDYFMGSAAAELPELATQFYSERLVLMPGTLFVCVCAFACLCVRRCMWSSPHRAQDSALCTATTGRPRAWL